MKTIITFIVLLAITGMLGSCAAKKEQSESLRYKSRPVYLRDGGYSHVHTRPPIN